MQFYDCKITFETSEDSKILDVMKTQPKKMWGDELIQDLNDELLEVGEEKNIISAIYSSKLGKFSFFILSDSMERLTANHFTKILGKIFTKEPYNVENIKVKDLREITPAETKQLLKVAESAEYLTYRNRFQRNGFKNHEDFSLDYYDNSEFKIEEFLFDDKKFSKQTALTEAKNLMADKTFTDEIERIFSDKNPKEFFGHPVHYKLEANNSSGAKKLAESLCKSLYVNKRLIGRCVSFIYDIAESCYRERDLENIFDQSAGGTIIIELRGSKEEHKNYASCYEEVVQNFVELVKKYQNNTLFIFVELTENPGFAPKLIGTLQEEIYLIEVKEGMGNRADALKYLNKLLKKDKFSYEAEEIENLLGEKTVFRPSDIHKIYDEMCRDKLRNNTYLAYKQASRLMIVRDDMKGKDAYQKLQEMIGLEKIKNIVSQIIGNAKIQKARSNLGLEQQKTSLHMVFTGNPGSAKTTVARLLAEILSKEGILSSGEFIECGRSDLVGKYVGWTAPAVKKQFKMAKGGVLFIDEAYSLVDDIENCYGDEAINTIVQEMENHRDDVIVIFAGYPDKMKNFLKRNEGLRSRIAFHVDFPNYSEEELLKILQLMTKNKGFELNLEIENKCRKIFEKVIGKEDFGNGRFVRNLLEQALLKQSQRIITENEGKEIGRAELLELKAEDFDVNVVEQYTDKKISIGFQN